MARGLPSMTALLGLLAVAGYQNRDKIAEMLGGLQQKSGTPGKGAQAGQGGILESLGGLLAGTTVGGLLNGGLRDLSENFKQKGQGDVVDSWVSKEPNKKIEPSQLEQAIGPDVLATLTQQTGLSKDELLSRLSSNLPDAIDKYTPDGRLPSDA